jgi:hypothetical protein
MNVLSLKTAMGVGAILYSHWRASKYPLFSLFFNTLEPSCVPFFCYFESFICLSFFGVAPYSFLANENIGEKTHV